MPARRETVTVAWATDTHFDHVDFDTVSVFIERVRASGASALLLGGDIATGVDIDDLLIELADRTGLPLFFVLGNHDYYGSSIATVRRRMQALSHPGLHWLPQTGPHDLMPGVSLVGHGGWGDARLGDFANSDVVLNDYLLISELRQAFDRRAFGGVFGNGTPLERELRQLGRDAADSLAPQLAAAAESSRQIIVLTHVPPFRDACWHEGRISNPSWLPAFTCGAVGEVLTAAATAHPGCRFTVLCGHTHGGGSVRITPDLVVHNQAAEYGRPGFGLVEISADAVEFRP